MLRKRRPYVRIVSGALPSEANYLGKLSLLFFKAFQKGRPNRNREELRFIAGGRTIYILVTVTASLRRVFETRRRRKTGARSSPIRIRQLSPPEAITDPIDGMRPP